MGDHHATEMRYALDGKYLDFNFASISWILKQIDCFVSQSRGTGSLEVVAFDPYAFTGGNSDVWDKVGQTVGNLQAL
jgi:hypothetical protein